MKIALTSASPSAASQLVCFVEHEVSVLSGLLLLNIQAAYQQQIYQLSFSNHLQCKKYSSTQLNEIWKSAMSEGCLEVCGLFLVHLHIDILFPEAFSYLCPHTEFLTMVSQGFCFFGHY